MTNPCPEKTPCACGVTGRKLDLAGLIDYQAGSIVSRTLLDKKTGTVTVFAFDRGQRLSEHTSPYDALVQVVDGRAEILIDGKPHGIGKAESIIMPANIPHAVNAAEPFKMLLTLIRS